MPSDAVTMTEDTKFNELLQEAIDEALSSLGESPKRAIYYNLEEHFSIPKSEIPHKIPEFTTALEEIFKSGAFHLKILMMKKLHEKIRGKINWAREEDLTFPEYVAAVKQEFTQKNKEGTK